MTALGRQSLAFTQSSAEDEDEEAVAIPSPAPSPQPAGAGDGEIPSTMRPEDRAIYAYAGERHGEGAVVELGPALGAGTRAVAEGLERGRGDALIYAVDRFVWAEVPSEFREHVTEGESFLDLFKANLDRFAGQIVPVEEDFAKLGGVQLLEETIGTVLVDGPRGVGALHEALTGLADRLVEGSRVVVHGVFLLSFDMAALLFSLPLRYERHAEQGSTYSFVVTGDLGPALAEWPARIKNVPADELVAAMKRIAATLPEDRTACFAASLCVEMLRRGEAVKAEETISRYIGSKIAKSTVEPALARALRRDRSAGSGALTGVYNLLRLNVPLAAPSAPGAGRGDSIEKLGVKDVHALGRSLAAPQSARELLAAFAMFDETVSREELTDQVELFKAAAASADLTALSALRPFLLGRTVLDCDAPSWVRGVIVRALGGARYLGAGVPPEPPGDRKGLGGIAFDDEAFQPYRPQNAEVVLLSMASEDSVVERAGLRLDRLPPGARLLVTIHNVRGAPSGDVNYPLWYARLAEHERAATIREILARLRIHFAVFHEQSVFADAAILARVDGSVLRRHRLTGDDLSVRSVTVGLERLRSQQADTGGLSYARRKGQS